MKFFKIFLATIGIFIVFLIAIPFIIPEKNYTSFLISHLEKKYGIDVRYENSSLSFFPTPALHFENGFVDILDESGNHPLLAFKKIYLSSGWSPIGQKKISLRLTIDGAKAHVIPANKENTNVDLLLKRLRGTHAASKKPLTYRGFALAPQEIQLKDTDFLILSRDRVSDEPETYHLKEGRAFDFKLTDEGLKGKISATGILPQVRGEDVEANGSFLYSPVHKAFIIRDAKVAIGSMKGTLTGRLDLKEKPSTFEARVQATGVGLRPALAAFTEPRKRDYTLNGKADVDLSVQGTTRHQEGSIRIHSPDFSFRMKDKLEIDEDAALLESFFTREARTLRLKQGKLKLGPQRITLNGVVGTRYSGTELDFSLPSVNTDYLKRVSPLAKDLPLVEGASLSGHYAEPLNSPSHAVVTGRLKALSVGLDNQEVKDLSLDFHYRSPHLKINHLQGKTLGGLLTGEGNVTTAGVQPAYQFQSRLEQVDLSQVDGLKGRLAGTGSLELKGTGQGFKDWKRTLNASGLMAARKVHIPSLDTVDTILAGPLTDLSRLFPNLIHPEGIKRLRSLGRYAENLTSKFRIEEGKLQVSKLSFDFPHASLDLNGRIGLEKDLNLSGQITLGKSLVQSVIKDSRLQDFLLQGRTTMALPVHISGTLTRPSFSPDMTALARQLRTYLQRQVIASVQDGIKERLGNELPSADGIFKGIPKNEDDLGGILDRMKGKKEPRNDQKEKIVTRARPKLSAKELGEEKVIKKPFKTPANAASR